MARGIPGGKRRSQQVPIPQGIDYDNFDIERARENPELLGKLQAASNRRSRGIRGGHSLAELAQLRALGNKVGLPQDLNQVLQQNKPLEAAGGKGLRSQYHGYSPGKFQQLAASVAANPRPGPTMSYEGGGGDDSVSGRVGPGGDGDPSSSPDRSTSSIGAAVMGNRAMGAFTPSLASGLLGFGLSGFNPLGLVAGLTSTIPALKTAYNLYGVMKDVKAIDTAAENAGFNMGVHGPTATNVSKGYIGHLKGMMDEGFDPSAPEGSFDHAQNEAAAAEAAEAQEAADAASTSVSKGHDDPTTRGSYRSDVASFTNRVNKAKRQAKKKAMKRAIASALGDDSANDSTATGPAGSGSGHPGGPGTKSGGWGYNTGYQTDTPHDPKTDAERDKDLEEETTGNEGYGDSVSNTAGTVGKSGETPGISKGHDDPSTRGGGEGGNSSSSGESSGTDGDNDGDPGGGAEGPGPGDTFAEGGYIPGDGDNRWEPRKITAHEGEYVLNPEMVRRLGISNLEALRKATLRDKKRGMA